MTELNLPLSFYATAAALFGLIIGSFLNVVIHRVPRGESIVFPGSHCPACGSKLRAQDNLPVLSFLLLRGHCRNCGKHISWRYPFVELLTGFLFAAILVKSGPTWEALLEMAFAAVLVSLIFIDAVHHLLPNVITYPAIVFALASATARAGWGEQNGGFEISIIIPALLPVFTPWKAALLGGLIFAAAAPSFWLLDRLDLLLYDKYFDWEEDEMDGTAKVSDELEDDGNPVTPSPHLSVPIEPEPEAKAEELNEAAAEARYQRTIRASIAFALLVAVAWAVLCVLLSPNDSPAFVQAYGGLWRALAGALVGGVPIWWLRAIYFYVRGVEGMGLGDVKLMAIIGAFLGWQGAFGVMLLGSILGTIIGALLIWRSKGGLRTALPFGVCLGAAALVVMLTK